MVHNGLWPGKVIGPFGTNRGHAIVELVSIEDLTQQNMKVSSLKLEIIFSQESRDNFSRMDK